MEPQPIEDGKTIAIISYITVIGLVIAIIMNNDKKNFFATFHIRQSLGIMLLGLLANLLFYPIPIPILPLLFNIFVFVLWLLGILSAIQGEIKPVPLLGENFQQWFKNL